MLAASPEGCRTVYRTGSPILSTMAPGVNYTFDTASANEITIAVLGLDPSLEGEEGDSPASTSGGDRDVIELPAVQLTFLKELRKHAKKLIIVLTGGSAIAVPEVNELADAVLQVWYPGCEGGNAVADVLFGDVSPSGKLPVTVPHRTADLPPFIDYAMKGRTYRFGTIEPLYPFGFGLGYAKLSYGPLALGATKLAASDTLTLRTILTNSSDRAALEAVQCYVQPPRSWPEAPFATLVDFQKVNVPAKSSVTVEFTVPAAAFAQVDSAGKVGHAPGVYGITVGSAAPGPRAVALGAPVPADRFGHLGVAACVQAISNPYPVLVISEVACPQQSGGPVILSTDQFPYPPPHPNERFRTIQPETLLHREGRLQRR